MITPSISFGVAPVYGPQPADSGPEIADREFADRGLTERYVVDVVVGGGEVYHHDHLFADLEAALAFRDRVAAVVRKCEHWWPGRYWFFVRRVPGSEAYRRHQEEEEHYLQSLEIERQHGVGSYGPAHPGWRLA